MLRKLNEGQKRTVAHWLMEFAVVVLGVLLALWLQERANAASDALRMRAAEDAIHAELDDNLMILVAHTAVDRCLSDRLGVIEDHIRTNTHAAAITGHPLMKPLGPPDGKNVDIIYVFFDMRVQDTAWNSALARCHRSWSVMMARSRVPG